MLYLYYDFCKSNYKNTHESLGLAHKKSGSMSLNYRFFFYSTQLKTCIQVLQTESTFVSLNLIYLERKHQSKNYTNTVVHLRKSL